jgi:hypothetical protein
MTFVPAKRVDRIFPVVPPLCLLLVEWCAAAWSERRVRVSAAIAVVLAALFAGGYFIGLVPLSHHERTQALVEFSRRAKELATARGIAAITLPRARDEGLLMYFDRPAFSDKSDAFEAWKAGKPMALVISDRTFERDFVKEVGPVAPALDSGELRGKNEKRYVLLLREGEAPAGP